jgi:RNA polymerase sigma-70 factor (ECF subfamily)
MHTHPSEADDRALVGEFLRTRRETAFRELHRRHTPALFRLATSLLRGAEADALDVLQDAWIRAVEGLGTFEGRSTLRTWLAGIVVRRVRELQRTRARRHALLDRHVLDAPAPAEVPPEVTLALKRAVLELPEGYREVLLMHDLEGFTHEEIAEALDIQPGTSKSQLHRARRHLRSTLNGKEEHV